VLLATALAELVVEHQHGRALGVDQLEPGDDLGGVLFLLDLLVDEPL